MNKLLLLSLLGFALIALTGGEEHASEGNLEVAQAQLELSRDMREADPANKKTSVNEEKKKSGKGKKKSRKGKKKSVKGKKKSGKGKKKSVKGKKKSRKGKTKSVKGKKKSRKGKKKSVKGKKKSRKGKKKSVKGKKKSRKGKKKSVKGKKKSRKGKKKSVKGKRKSKKGKRKSKKGKRKSRKGKRKGKKGKKSAKKGRKGKKSGKETTTSTCVGDTCITNAINYMKMMKDKVANYLQQKSRMTRQNGTGDKKSGKKNVFKPTIMRLIESGGGNASSLSCGGSTTSVGAKQMKNLTDHLMSCSSEIKKACDPSNLPQPNFTEITTCTTAMTSFSTKLEECRKLSNGTACTCWASDTLSNASTIIKNCSLSTEATAFAKAVTTCRNAFGKCRKYEDDVGSIINSCALTPAALKTKLKSLAANSAALTAAKTKLSSLSSRRGRVARAITTCADLITSSKKLVTYVEENPASTLILSLATEISSASVTCTTAEKESIKTQITSLETVIVMISNEVAAVQATLEESSGSTASSADIAAAADCVTADCSPALDKDSSETASASTDPSASTAGSATDAAATDAAGSGTASATASATPSVTPSVTPSGPVTTAMPPTAAGKRRRQAVEDILKSKLV